MKSYEELLGRALVAAGGLTPQSRHRTMIAPTFRSGAPRLIRHQLGSEVDQDVLSVYQPLLPRLDPQTASLRATSDGGGDDTGDGLDGPFGGSDYHGS